MDSFHINGLDLAVGIILLLSAIFAFLRGFVHEVLSVTAWIGAIFAVIYGVPELRPFVRAQISNEIVADSVVGVVIFLTVLTILSIVTKILSKSIQSSALNNLDRSLGFVYGLARGAVIFAAVLIIIDWVVAEGIRPNWLRAAKTLPAIELTADLIRDILPETFMAAKDAAKEASDTAREAMELRETFEKLAQPPPGVDSDAIESPEGAYEDDIRRNMYRLFQTNQDDGN